MSTSSRVSMDKRFAIAATVAVVVGIIAGFWVLGTPGRQRAIAADRQRLRDLRSIAFELHRQAETPGSDFQLPPQLNDRQQREDPLTGNPYTYQRLSASTFELCAEFATDSSTYPLQTSSEESEFWQHPQGPHCFEFAADEQPPSLY